MPVRNIALIVNTQSGKVANPTQKHPFTIKAQSGATYSVVNKTTGSFPENLTIRRNGDALEIEVEQEVVARIENFYGDGVKAIFSLDGTLTPAKGMAINGIDAPALTDTTESDTIWENTTVEEEGTAPWVWAAAALGAGSIATAFAGYSDKDSSGSSSSDEAPGSAASTSGYDILVTGAAGPFQSAALVEVYDINGNLLANGEFDAATGQARLTISNGYQGPVLVKISDNNGSEGDYLSEATNTSVNLGQPLRAMGNVDGSGDLLISVTPLTELAVRYAGIADNSVSEADLAVNDQIATLFGVEDLLAMVVTVLGSDYDSSDGYSAAEYYGAVLAQLSGSDTVTGSLSNTLDLLETEIIDLGSGELAFTPEAVDLLVSGTDAFTTGPNSSLADLMETLIHPPVIEAAAGGINEAEKNAGVIIKTPNVSIGDKVTLYWGDQSLSFIINDGNFVYDETASIFLPGSIIDLAGDGDITVRYQVNDGEESPAVIVTVDTSGTDTVISDISLSEDTGSMSDDFITREASQTISATLNTELSEGETLYGSTDGGNTWVGIGDTVTGGTTISWSGVLLSGISSIQFKITDSSGNDGEIISQPYIIDTTAPTISINPVASDGIINAAEDNNDIIITGTCTDVENSQSVTLTLNGVTYTGAITDNEWSITLPAADAQALPEGAHTMAADVSDLAGNPASQTTASVTHSSVTPEISINVIAGDDMINAVEDNSNLIITGTTTNVESGQSVTINLNGQSYTDRVTDNEWSVSVPANRIRGLPEGLNGLTADVSDLAGNDAPQAIRTLTYDSESPTIAIDIIAADGIINAGEDNSNVTISGTSGGAENGQTVTVALNGQSYTGTVSGNVWSVIVPATDAQDLPEGLNSLSAEVSDIAGNSADASGSLIHDSIAPTASYNDAAYTGNTLTLTGVNIATLLSDGESGTTDLQDNFDWSKLEWNIAGDDSSTITFSGTDIAGVYALNSSTLAITLESSKADALEATESFDPLTADDTVTVSQGFSGDTAGNSSATDAYVSTDHVDESIVVFDMVNNVSSNHSGRQFDAGTSYSIYILVDATKLPSGEQPADQFWNVADNLGADDKITLVSYEDGRTILGAKYWGVNNHLEYSGSQLWKTGILESSLAFVLEGDGDALRYWSGHGGYDLWNGTVPNMIWGGTGLHTLATLPAGIMTSQGLA